MPAWACGTLSRGADYVVIEAFVERDDARGAELCLRGATCLGGHFVEPAGSGKQLDTGLGHASDVADFKEQTIFVVLDELRDATDAGEFRVLRSPPPRSSHGVVPQSCTCQRPTGVRLNMV